MRLLERIICYIRLIVAGFIAYGNIMDIDYMLRGDETYERVYLGEVLGPLSFSSKESFVFWRSMSVFLCLVYVVLVILLLHKKSKWARWVVCVCDALFIAWIFVSFILIQ